MGDPAVSHVSGGSRNVVIEVPRCALAPAWGNPTYETVDFDRFKGQAGLNTLQLSNLPEKDTKLPIW